MSNLKQAVIAPLLHFKPVKPERLPNGKYKIYFSFWSWKMLKTCALQYRLRLFEDLAPASLDKGNAIQGGVPDKMAEDFFNWPLEKRRQLGLHWFYENFEQYWSLWQKEAWVDWTAHNQEAKKKETLEHIEALVDLLNDRKLNDLNVQSQLSFKVKIEEGPDYELSVGGRIDLLFEVMPGIWDIWDMKGVKQASYNDKDQLSIYKMGMQAMGRTIRNTGFLLMKQKKFDTKPLSALAIDELKTHMVKAYKQTIAKGLFFANYQRWSCGYCDMRLACATYVEKTQKQDLTSLFAEGVENPGRVRF